ncbi:thaumatin [Chytridium lagenaria]|nr:thaumatin [Chytridium lagenaria]
MLSGLIVLFLMLSLSGHVPFVHTLPTEQPSTNLISSCGTQGYDPRSTCAYPQPTQTTPLQPSYALSSPNACASSASLYSCYNKSSYCCTSSGTLAPAGSCTSTPPPTTHPLRVMEITNNCPHTIWPAVYGLSAPNGIPKSGGWQQLPGANITLHVPSTWTAGRIWARTACGSTSNRPFFCATGDCGPNVSCSPLATGEPNVLLAEWTFVPGTADWMDISAVDSYNVGISIEAIGGTDVDGTYYGKCGLIKCSWPGGVEGSCPPEYQLRDATGAIVACRNDDQVGTGPRAKFFKKMCPDAYSWPYDDFTSTFLCRDPKGYRVVFCPAV